MKDSLELFCRRWSNVLNQYELLALSRIGPIKIPLMFQSQECDHTNESNECNETVRQVTQTSAHLD